VSRNCTRFVLGEIVRLWEYVGNELIAFLKKQFDKPVKFCFLSHHHPDHSGAAAAFSEIGAELITTEKNVPFFKKICALDHTMGSPSIIVKGEQTNYVVVDSASSKSFFKKTKNEVIAYEMGTISKHTEEYLIFYFPKEGILFVPDLVFFPEKGIKDQKQRAYSVYETIKMNKLKVSKIYTGWPLENYKDYGTMDDLKESLKKNFPTIK
jgi:Metallo-beta-lactamase superfamily